MILRERNVLVGIRNNASKERRLFSVLKLLTFLLVLAPALSWAQCNCNFTIAAGSGYVNFDGAAKGVKAGDVICVNAGNIGTIQFSNIRGSATNPVTIKNCGGQVVLGGTSAQNGFLFFASRYVHITGTGAAGVNYGFKVSATASGSQGVAYAGLSSDVEIDHMEIANTGYSGMMIKTDPSSNCADKSATRPNFTLYNVKIHDNYIHNTGGEGIYLGDSFYLGTNVFCGQMEYCHEVRGVRIYNNRFESTGRESIQVGAGVSDVEIYNNSVYNYGAQNIAEQNGGVQLGVGTAARFYNNLIKNGRGPALAIQGIGNEYIYNNVFVNPGTGGAITINTRPTPLSTDIVNKGYLGGVYLINNTFVNAATGAAVEYVNGAPGNVMYNNLVVASATKWDNTYTYTDWKKSNNVVVPVLANAKFANAGADDYRLLSGSPAINAGRDVSAWGVTKDAANQARPYGGANDAGAYELVGAPSSSAPVANAGGDKTITLPLNSVGIAGSGSDSDGSITAYSWSKISGSACTMTNTNTATMSVMGLTAGSYVFRLTVTDNSGLTDTDDMTVTVKSNTTNIAPVANAGSDKTIASPLSTASLSGSGTDSDGTITSYSWTKVSGGIATLLNNLTSTLSLSALIPGTYVFRLTVTDNQGATDYDDVTVTVSLSANQSPTVNAGGDKSITLPTSSVSLTSSASDPDGSITAYAWTKQSGPSATMSNANTATLSASSLTSGTYVFRQTVTDNRGATAFDDVSVVVNAAPSTPTVVYRVNCGSPNTISASPVSWMADTQTSPISYLDHNALNYTCGATTWSGSNSTGAPNDLFGPNRYSPDYAYATQMAWNFPLASGTYQINLFFAETPYAGGVRSSGSRVFGIKMENNTVLNNFDIYATAGMNAVKKSFTVSVTDGTLDIDFVRIVGNPQVNGIEIVRTSGGAGRMAAPEDVTAADGSSPAVEESQDTGLTSVDVYPNPFSNELNVRFGSTQSQSAVALMSVSGQVVYQQEFTGSSELNVDLSSVNVPAGVYILTVTSEKGKEVRKLLKQ